MCLGKLGGAGQVSPNSEGWRKGVPERKFHPDETLKLERVEILGADS